MSHRMINVNLPLSILQNPSMIELLKSCGWITYLKYCECASESVQNHSGQRLIRNGYIISFISSEVLFATIGVSRKGLIGYHKSFERCKLARVFSTSKGYLVVLGKRVNDVDKFFIGDTEFYDSEISKIENIYSGEDVEEEIEEEIIRPKIIKRKKIKKKVVPEKKIGLMEQMKKANEKVRKQPEEYKASVEKRKESVQNPSQKLIYKKYKKRDIEEWGCEDYLGFYLDRFVDMMGTEDFDFVNVGRSKTKMLLMNMGKFKKIYFDNKNDDFRNYIGWAMEYINNPETWITSAVSIYSIVVNNLSKNLVKEYFIQKTKAKVINRVKADSEYSEEDYWRKKYLGK